MPEPDLNASSVGGVHRFPNQVEPGDFWSTMTLSWISSTASVRKTTPDGAPFAGPRTDSGSKRLFRLDGTISTDEGNVFHLRRKGPILNGPPIELLDPKIGEDDARAIADELGEIMADDGVSE